MNVSDKDVGEKWLFLFCFCVGLCVSSKTKCATCVVAVKLKNKKCAVAKNKNSLHLLVGLAVNRSRMLSKNVGVMSVCLMLVMSSNRVSGNVLALGAVADFGGQNCQCTTKVDAR